MSGSPAVGSSSKLRIAIITRGSSTMSASTSPFPERRSSCSGAARKTRPTKMSTWPSATRWLQDHVRKVTGHVKAHEVPVHGTVVRLSREDGYGFIETSEGDEIYFHRNSVVDGSFEDLDVGQEVRLVRLRRE